MMRLPRRAAASASLALVISNPSGRGVVTVVFIALLRAFDDLREAVEPLQPRADALESVGDEHARAGTTDLLRRHELRLLEQPDVLLHPGQRHAERLGELADRCAAGTEPFEYRAAGRVGEGCEGAVDGRSILNHSVHYSGSALRLQDRGQRLPTEALPSGPDGCSERPARRL